MTDQPRPPAAQSTPAGSQRFRRSWQAMATQFDIELVGGDREHLEAVATAIEEEVRRFDQLLSRHDATSEVSRINREAAIGPVKVDADVWKLLVDCEKFRHATDGFFDVTAGMPSNTPPAESLAAVCPRLLLDPDRQTVRFYSTDVAIDLGGIGKGFALDRAHEILKRFSIPAALVSGGTSSILSVGRPSAGEAWTVEIRNPAHEELPPVDRLELTDRSLSCSTALRPGQYVSDVVDPHTQQPLVGSNAVVVLAPSGVVGEALSTGLLAMGPVRAAEYLGRSEWTKVEKIEVAWIDASAAEPTLRWITRDDARS